MQNGWEVRLTRSIEAYQGRVFRWGVADCCTFTADAVQAMTGKNLYKPFLGQYTGRKTATLALRREGVRSLSEYLKLALGDPRPIKEGSRGDVIYDVFDDGPTIGIFDGLNGIYFGESDQGSLIKVAPGKEARIFKHG